MDNRLNPRSLLVVDDDPAIRELLTSILHREGRHIVGAPDGHTALDELRRGRYHILVAGLGRNGMDSLDLLREAQRVSPHTPVIVTAERCDPERVVAAIRAHAYSYFHKPLPPGPLVDMVQQALESADGWANDIRVLSSRPDFLTVTIRCKLEAGDRMVQFVREATADLPVSTRDDIAAAFRELVMNSIEHGGRQNPANVVKASLIRTRQAILAHLSDPGPGFSLEGVPHAAISNPQDSPLRHVEIRAEQGQRPGGFGILMTKNLVDELLYNERGNEVMFVKYLT